jgi:hypothetical protein
LAKDKNCCEEKDITTSGRNGAPLLEGETLRSASTSPCTDDRPRGEEKLSVFWRVFGGTILSIAALICLTVYNNFSSTLTDLRKELHQLYEGRAELVKKEELQARTTTIWSSIKELQQANTGLQTLNERSRFLDQQLDRQMKSADEERRDLSRKMEEVRRAAEDERKEMNRKLEEHRKVSEMERNDLLRRLEEQRRAAEDEHKELNRSLKTLGERLAILEARQPNKKSTASWGQGD